MTDHAEPGVASSFPPAVPATTARPGRFAWRFGGLLRKYALLFLGLVGLALTGSAAVDLWFSYGEQKSLLLRLQQEQGVTASRRIEQFIEEIQRQIGWTTHAQWGAGSVEQRRFDYVRLLRQVPAITEISQLDGDGREQLRVSRLAMDAIGSQLDLSKDPRFTEALNRKVWFSPVYFRKESEPYLTISIPRAGRNAGVTVAEINLKHIWDVILSLKIGRAGYAYVVDSRGRLLAHPDISLVLRNTDLSGLPQVKAALQDGGSGDADELAVVTGPDGRKVISAHAPIPNLGWMVFVELPFSEALEPVVSSIIRTLIILGIGLALAALAAIMLARHMVGPILQLQEGASQIGAGHLDRRIEIRTGDELEGLAQQFNAMAGQLAGSYADLERKVEERTHELDLALRQQTATAEAFKVISRSAFDLGTVFETLASSAVELCRADRGVIFLRQDDAFHAVAAEGAEDGFLAMMQAHPRRLNEESIVPKVARANAVVHIQDLEQDPGYQAPPGAERFRRSKTMLGVPMMRDGRVEGVFALMRFKRKPFTERQIEVAQTFADQAVIAVENVRLLERLRERTRELQEQSEMLRQASQHKSQFLANMSHELRTPLNAILGYTELLVDGIYGELPAKPLGVLERVQANGKHLLGLINDVLDLSKIEAGQLSLASDDYTVESLVSSVVSATESLARNKGLAFSAEVAPGLPPGRGDARRLSQVLLNLIGNAVKFTDSGEVRITAGLDGENFRFEVHDTGPGIGPEDLSKIFEEFQQVDNSSTRKKGGTGLGLAISRRIVEMHGGSISVDSEPGKGSCFRVTIPVQAAAPNEDRA